jgi:hypothetical protein
MKQLFALLTALTMAAPALAASVEGRARRYPLGDLLSAAKLNDATAANRTATTTVDDDRSGYDVLVLYVDHTNNSATDVQMTCTNTPETGSNAATIQSCSVALGACTSNNATWSNAVSGDETFVWRVDVTGYPGSISCVFSGTSSGASDTIDVQGWLTTK